jgi:hydroxymethylbilane synthase
MCSHLSAITDGDSWHAALAERALLRTLHGGCNVPLGAHARISENALSISARVLASDGKECIEARALGLVSEAEELGERVARELQGQGAERLMEAARS